MMTVRKAAKPVGKRGASSQVTKFKTMKAVMDAATDKLATSVLGPKDAKELRLEVYSADEASRLSGLPASFAGIMIPYFDLRGRATKFWRYRYLEDTKTGWDKLTDKKALRYAQPKGSVNEVYLPPLNGTDWTAIAANTEIPIIITEGELKAASATKHGYPTMGLGGVWCFKSSSAKMSLLPIFKEFNWKGRSVYIAYDSDAITNPQVMQAENALARELMLQGAEPLIMRIGAIEGQKAGLDDVIWKQGEAKIAEYLEDAVEWRAAQELFALNQEVTYVRDPGIILELESLRRISPRAFVDHAYSTRIYYEQQQTQSGTKLVERSAAKEWLKWPSRGEVERITYAPGEGRITKRNELNMWRGWGVEPEKGDIRMWHELMEFIFDGDQDAIKWFTQWCAYPMQHPGEKMYSCVVVHGGEHGTGKSLIGHTLGHIYGSNFTEIKDKDIQKGDNDWAENKQFVMGDEITGGEKRHAAEELKTMITQPYIRINIKYVPRFTIPDCINYYFSSNHPDAFFIEDKDRRYFIWEVTKTPMPRSWYIAYINSMKRGPLAKNLFHYLLNVDLKGFDAQGPAMLTAAKVEMIEGGRSDVANWVAQLRQDPDTILRFDRVVLKHDLWRCEDLLALYDPERRGRVTANGLARELKRAGFQRPCGPLGCRTTTGQVRLWAIRNADKYKGAGPNELGRDYDAERGRDGVTDPARATVPVRRKKF